MSVAAFEPDARPFPGARQGFDPRATTTFKKDGQTTEHPRSFVTSLTADEANAARLAALRWKSSSASPPAPPTASNSSPNAPSRDRTQKPYT